MSEESPFYGSAISFVAIGTPVPKGSMKAFMRPGMRFPIVTNDNDKTRPWASAVQNAAIVATKYATEVLFKSGPVSVDVDFYLPRPKSLPNKVTAHCKKPDVDKLLRAILDALKGVIWTDDSQVVDIHGTKHYATIDMPRAEIHVSMVREGPKVDREFFKNAPDAEVIEQLGLRCLGMGS
jgi:crossover junction endodeoxyribonuclease RusA